MAEKIGRFKPGDNVSVFAKTAILAGRFVAITDAKTSRGDYQGGHASAGDEHPFGVSQRDSGPTTLPAHSTERLVECMTGGIPFVQCGEEIAALDDVAVGAAGKAVVADSAVAASLVTGKVADNNAILFTANEAGTVGNKLSVEILNTGKGKTLSVDVDGNKIVVTAATNEVGAGEITSTATLVEAAILEHDVASQLVTAVNSGASTGAGVVAAVATTKLEGGTESTGGTAAVGKALTAGKLDEYIEVQVF